MDLPVEANTRRFWHLASPGRWDQCWEWQGGRTSNGYGSFRWRRKSLGAHRVMFALVYGPIPEGLFVLHRCDNPPCVNPLHLFVGTQSDNMKDCWRKGRHNPAAMQAGRLKRGHWLNPHQGWLVYDSIRGLQKLGEDEALLGLLVMIGGPIEADDGDG